MKRKQKPVFWPVLTYNINLVSNMKTYYVNNKSKNHVNTYTDTDAEVWHDLISYTTRVAAYNETAGYISIYGWFSATTAGHINDFLDHLGQDRMTKKQMLERPTIQMGGID